MTRVASRTVVRTLLEFTHTLPLCVASSRHGNWGSEGQEAARPGGGTVARSGGRNQIGPPQGAGRARRATPGGPRCTHPGRWGVWPCSGGAGRVPGPAATALPARARTVNHPAWATGMGSSVRAGIDALPPDVDAVVIALADQPLVTHDAVRRLLDAREQGARAAVATYNGNQRNPVMLGREYWSTVYGMAVNDVGARAFLRAYSHVVTPVACDDIADPEDIDTEEDLERLSGLFGGS